MVTRTSSILGPDGRPIVIQTLSEEIATPTVAGVRRTHEERVASGLTPERLGTILRDAAIGEARSYLTLAEEMEERYLHYASQLQTRRLAIEGIEVTVEAGKAKTNIVDAVTELVNDTEFGEALGNLTDGISKGYAAVEMMWEYERKTLRPVNYIARDPRFFQVDRLTLSEMRLAVDGSIEGVELPQAKFLRHMPRTKMGLPLRRGMARPAAWGYLIQQFTLQDWAAFSEVYGMPLRVGKYNAAASPADKRTLLKAVASIANDAAAIIPAGMDIEFHEVNGANGAAVFGGLLEYVDKQISKLVVGQTMTSDDGSSLGQAKIHNEVRLDILRADCKQLARTANRDLIQPFVDLNFGPQDHYPQVQLLVADPEDIDALTNAVARMVPFGLRVKQTEIREKIGLSDPGDGDELLMPTAAATAAPTPDQPPAKDSKKPTEDVKAKVAALSAIVVDHRRACRCGACVSLLAAEAGEPDALDQVEALFAVALDDWEEMAKPIVQPIADIITSAASFEEALKLIETAGPDASKMAERLGRLTAIARGVGDIAD
ncbi:Mu-like prophage FluMu protein Gp29 [Neorhizobium galegae bv. orientalis]|nr:Mu-like prophage FluMu protein Gp29 [Neorhizobium galegae bv. orientalis]